MGTGKPDFEITGASHCGFVALENFHEVFKNNTKSGTLFEGCLTACHVDECNTALSSLTAKSDKIFYLIFFPGYIYRLLNKPIY
jgi:hypothetical protein